VDACIGCLGLRQCSIKEGGPSPVWIIKGFSESATGGPGGLGECRILSLSRSLGIAG
jgi:hypothetical protein